MIRAFLISLLLLVLIAVCGYNTWQIGLLQTRVDKMAADARHHPGAIRHGKEPPRAADDSASAPDLVARAHIHADRARVAVEEKNFGVAQAEWQAATDDLNKASSTSTAAARSQLDGVRNQLARIQNATNSYLKHF